MKRILSLLSLMVLSVFTITACKSEPSADELLADDLVNSIILAEDNGVVNGNFSLISKLTRDEAEYPLTWVSDNKNVKVTDKVSNDAYIVEVNRNIEEEQTANLKVTLNLNKAVATRDFKVTIQPYDVFDYLETYKFPLEHANLTNKVYELDSEWKAPGADNAAKITWAVDSDLITITTNSDGKQTATAKVKFEKVPAKFTATFTYNNETATQIYDVNVLDTIEYKYAESVKENTVYKLGLVQKELESAYLWVNGKTTTNKSKVFATTTTDVKDALDAQIENCEGGFHIYVMDGKYKNYLNATNETVKFEKDAKTVYTFDEKHHTAVYEFEKSKFFLGTYNKYNTVSANKGEYIAKDNNFLLRFYEKEAIEANTPVYSSEVMVDYEVEKFHMYNLQPGENKLTLTGKKFNQVEISYKLNGANDNVTLSEDGKTITGKVIDKEAEVKLIVTFKHGEYSVDKDVTVKLNATVVKSLKDVAGLKDYTPVTVTAKVVAKEGSGIMLEDATGCMYVRSEGSLWTNVPSVGKIITFTAVKSSYHDAPQLNPVTFYSNVKETEENKITPKDPIVYDSKKLEAAISKPVYERVKFTGVVNATKYINVKIENTEKTFSIKGSDSVLETIRFANGLKVEIDGYVSGSNSKNGYLTVIANTVVNKDTNENLLNVVKKAVEAALPTTKVEDKTNIQLFNDFEVQYTVTTNEGSCVTFNSKSSILTIDPTLVETNNNIKIVITVGDKTATVEKDIKAQTVPSTKLSVAELGAFNDKAPITDTPIAIEGITFTFNKSYDKVPGQNYDVTPSKKYGDQIRFYAHNELNINAGEKKITKIEFDATSAGDLANLTVSAGKITFNGTTAIWTGTDLSEVLFKTTKQIRLNYIKVFTA